MKIEKTNIGFRIINPGTLALGTYEPGHAVWDTIKEIAQRMFGDVLKENHVLIRVEAYRGIVSYEFLVDPNVYVSQHIGVQVLTRTPDIDEYDSGHGGTIEPDVSEQVQILLKDVPEIKGLRLERVQRRKGLAQYSFKRNS